mmetsp:Transcript_16278/g.46111  ORF Transcript_16278/g.46111 Transcript_16278/m.46111 type:complete len:440 (+) Transcript_16278:133-1452(+)
MLLALLLLLAATTAALEQDGKDYDLYTTASALRNLAGGFASEVEVTADGRVKKLIFDGTADLLAEARALVNALGVTQGEGCEDRDCAAKELVNMMRGTVDARRRTAGEALDLAQLRIATTTRGHFHVVHTRDSFVGASLEAAGTFEEPALRLMLAVVRPGDVVVDAGANLGAHLVPLAVAVADGRHAPVSDAGRLVAFEPQAIPHAQLHASLLMLGSARIPSAVVAYRAAAGAKDGGVASIPTLDDRGAPQNFAQLSLVEGAFHGRPDADEYENYTVPVRSIDSVLKEMSLACPSLIKVDVEGQEDDALRGAAKTIKKCRPVLYVENNHYPAAGIATRHCRGAGYVAFHHAFSYAALFPRPRSREEAAYHADVADRSDSRNLLCVASAERLAGLPETIFLEVVPGWESAAAALPPDLLARLTRPVDEAVLYPNRGAPWE